MHSDVDAMTERSAVRRSRRGMRYLRLREWLARLYRAENDDFIAANTGSPLSLLTPRLARLVAFGASEPGAGSAGARPRRAAAARFSFQSLYAGVARQRALAVYGVIS